MLMDVRNDDGCLVCGSDNPTGLQTKPRVDPENACAELTVTIPQRFQGWSGLVHGGILATLLDEVSIYACMAQGGQYVTAGINIRYLKPVPVETEVAVRAEVVESRRRRRSVKARLTIAGEVHAEAETTVMEVRTPAEAEPA